LTPHIIVKRLLRSVLLTLIIFAITQSSALAQVVSGKVISKESKEPIIFANVMLSGPKYVNRSVGVSSDEKGVFSLTAEEFPVEIEVSALGFKSKKVTIEKPVTGLIIELEESAKALDEFVITEEKISQEDLRAPIETIKVNIAAIQSTPSFNFFDAVGNLKGVDLTTQSVVVNTVNTRGFNSTTNQRFRQFSDGIDNQAPGLSFSLGNIVGPGTLDIESYQILPGPSSAFYGPSSFNGVLEMKTKNAFDYPGLTFSAKGATVSVVKDNSKFLNIGENFIRDVAARYAFTVKDRVGVKVSAAVLDGVDFRARNYENFGPGKTFENVHSADNQSVNLVNAYGDDRSAFLVVPSGILAAGGETGGIVPTETDTAFTVTRSGYREEDLVNYNASNTKLNAEVAVKITPDMSLALTSFYSKTDAMITSEDRIALRDFEVYQQKAELQGKRLLVRAYSTQQDAGNTYNVGLLADELVQRAKPDEIWYDQYTRLYNAGRGVVGARVLADSQFPGTFFKKFEPGTDQYDSIRNEIITTEITQGGARIFDESRLYHVEGKYEFEEAQDYFSKLTLGGNYRVYDPESAGTIFTDTIGNDLTNFEFGAFIEGTKAISDRTDVSASIRIDKNENFDAKLSQRLSVVRQKKENQFFRASFQRGFRFANIREQFYNQNLGDKIIIGGLPEVTDAYDLQGNAFIQQSLQAYQNELSNSVINDDAQLEFAKLQHLDIAQNGIVRQDQFRALAPEQITAFEIGYKSLIQNRRIFEVNYYRNYYQNFIGNLRVVKPRTSPSVDLIRAVEQAASPGTSEVIFVTANSDRQIVTQGLEMVYDITGLSGINFAVNATFADIIQDSDDPLVPGFNTPPFKFNVKVGHRRISENFAAELTWRSRTGFDWQSPFADGRVEGFSTFDIQLTFKLPKANSLLRFGGNNIYNIDQFNSFGGPEINAFYYVSFTFDPFQSR